MPHGREYRLRGKIAEHLRRRFPGSLVQAQPASALTGRGRSDLIACVLGRFIAIEVKTDDGATTRAQEQYLETVRRAGGVALVARSAAEAERLILEGLMSSNDDFNLDDILGSAPEPAAPEPKVVGDETAVVATDPADVLIDVPDADAPAEPEDDDVPSPPRVIRPYQAPGARPDEVLLSTIEAEPPSLDDALRMLPGKIDRLSENLAEAIRLLIDVAEIARANGTATKPAARRRGA